MLEILVAATTPLLVIAVALLAEIKGSAEASKERDREINDAIRILKSDIASFSQSFSNLGGAVRAELNNANQSFLRLEDLVGSASNVGERVSKLEQAIVVRSSPDAADPHCPYCHDDLETDDVIVCCDRCKARHHLECMASHKNCAVFGCARAAHAATPVQVDAARRVRANERTRAPA